MLRAQLGPAWDSLKKRWLIEIDWCRSDPSALARLDALRSSQVKVPAGRLLVERSGCIPDRPYHPKLFMLIGKQSGAIICGSGNLSANGLTGGCECGSVFLVRFRETSIVHPQLAEQQGWFRSAWDAADPYTPLQADYEARCDAIVRDKKPAPTEDDVKPSEAASLRRGLSILQIRQLRTYDNLWIEAGSLGANLGPGVPGNQLDMTRYTRVFFGAPATDLASNTITDHITLVWDDRAYPDRTLKFGDNGMDKLNVPPAGARGSVYYRNKTLLFSRLPNGTFSFTAGADTDRIRWRRMSERKRASYTLGRRQWGLF